MNKNNLSPFSSFSSSKTLPTRTPSTRELIFFSFHLHNLFGKQNLPIQTSCKESKHLETFLGPKNNPQSLLKFASKKLLICFSQNAFGKMDSVVANPHVLLPKAEQNLIKELSAIGKIVEVKNYTALQRFFLPVGACVLVPTLKEDLWVLYVPVSWHADEADQLQIYSAASSVWNFLFQIHVHDSKQQKKENTCSLRWSFVVEAMNFTEILFPSPIQAKTKGSGCTVDDVLESERTCVQALNDFIYNESWRNDGVVYVDPNKNYILSFVRSALQIKNMDQYHSEGEDNQIDISDNETDHSSFQWSDDDDVDQESEEFSDD